MVPHRKPLTLHTTFKELRKKLGVSWELIKQDYLLSWVLGGIAATPELQKLLLFKGGTALKKMYFGHYRFSQDLDFTITEYIPSDEQFNALIGKACSQAMELQTSAGAPLLMHHQWYTEQQPHPHNQKAFIISAQFPWHREPMTTIMVEITLEEEVILPTPPRSVIHGYNEHLNAQIKTYALEEITAEKIRAILQFAQKLHERGWARSRARDFYDLWSILSTYKEYMDLELIPEIVIKKCSSKGIVFSGPTSLFTADLIKDLNTAWERWLAPFVPQLPPQKRVLEELQKELALIWLRNKD